MDANERAAFISAYAKVVVAVWHDPQFTERLRTEPAAALASCGLATVPQARINIVHAASGSGDIDQQVEAWERGATTHEYTLYLPASQQSVDRVHLDSQDLEALHGEHAGDVQAADVTACCCCTPCCTCT